MNRAYLSLGSNVNAESNIKAAIRALEAKFSFCRFSPIYRSRAVGFEGEDFINLAAMIETDMGPLQLRDWLRDLEDRFGRDRRQPKFSDRTLDIDILLMGDLVRNDDTLDLPRAEILKFAHVLKPLADLAPEFVHPTEQLTLAQLWAESGLDASVLEKIELGILSVHDSPKNG